MAIKKYNKLIRDLVPEAMAEKGVKFTLHEADQVEFDEKLREKLEEEVKEYLENSNPEEIEQIRQQKATKRGGFKKKLILEQTEE